MWKSLFSKRVFPPLVTVLLILVCVGSLALLLSGSSLSITKENIVVRTQPSTNSVALLTLKKDQTVQVLKESEGWYKIRVEGKEEGWIPIWLVNGDQLTHDQQVAAQILIDTPLYQSENEQSDVLLNIPTGETVQILSESRGWAKVTFQSQTGYLRTRAVSLVPLEQPKRQTLKIDDETKTSINGEEILHVRAAHQAFHSQADINSDILYTVEPNQKFKYISTTTSEDGTEFYLAEDEKGQRGYLDSRNVAKESDSINHISIPNATEIKGAIILLDAGHGGDDSGAIHDYPPTEEKYVALSTTLALKKELEKRGATIYLTRQNDQSVSLEERAHQSNSQQVDAFISIHFDDADDSSVSGTTSYFFHENDRLLANMVNSELAKLNVENNGVRFGNYFVLRENNRPSLLLELGYMSNDSDVELIRTAEYQTKVATAIADGIELFFKNIHTQ